MTEVGGFFIELALLEGSLSAFSFKAGLSGEIFGLSSGFEFAAF